MMVRRAWLAAVLLASMPAVGFAQFDEDKLIRDWAKTLSKDRDAKDRVSAAEALGGREKPEAVAALAKALSDPDASVREAAASALWKTGKPAAAAKPELQRALDDREAAVAARAAGALSVMGVPDEELAPAWRRVLEGSRDKATAFLAARGLIGIDPPETIAPPILVYLARNAEDAERPSRGRSSSDSSTSAEAAQKALEQLLRKNAGAVVPLLDKTVRQSPESGRYVFAALATVKTLPPGALDLALSQTSSSDARTRDAAIGLAGKMKSERDAARWIPEATRLLDDPNESVRMEACWVLKGVKGLAHPAAAELARLVAGDRSMRVRTSAAAALEEIGDASNPVSKAAKAAVAAAAREALAAAMKDKDHDLAPAAVGAYNVLYLDSAEIVAGLADVAVSGADASARQRALQCLRNRQGQAKSALGAIRPLANGGDKLVADEARAAIDSIQRGGAGSPAALKVGTVASNAKAAPPSRAPSAPERAESPAPEAAPSGGEERGLAVLREHHLEFEEGAFYAALAEGNGEIIRAYLDAGMSANLAFAGQGRRSPLMILFFHGAACAKPDEGHAIVALLLQRGADVNQLDENKNTALFMAADKCDRQTLRMLLKAGAKLNARNGSGLTALEMGIVMGNPGVEELIAAGARLAPDKAKTWGEAYKKNPKVMGLIRKAQ
ncbi:MAG: HEAT repeat domain-containing protein [Acidobacteriota bacterium]